MEVSKSDLEKLSAVRLQEAALLLKNKKYSGAYYLAGYSIELALKACIAKDFRSGVLPDKKFVLDTYSHDLAHLIGVARLQKIFDKEIKENIIFSGNWGIVREWTEQARYQLWDAASATALYKAISDPQYGMHQWLEKHY